jgi:hypothetical protein
MNEKAHNVVQFPIAGDGCVPSRGRSNVLTRQPSWNFEAGVNGMTWGQFLDQLEEENRQLRAVAADLELQIRALRDRTAATLIA